MVAVTEDEAGILRDFFRVQSDKHGPELLSRLNNIEYGEGRGAGGKVKMEEVVEEVIQQELQAESLALRNSSPGSECSSEGPGPCLPEHVALSFGSPGPRAVGPWLLGHGGLLLSLPLQEQAALGELLRLQQGGGLEGPPAQRGVSVIQRAPASRGPRHYLEKRDQKRAGGVGLTPLHLLKRKAGEQEEGPAKRRSNQQQSDHLICEVCGERAGKHSYYGGQVCPSCRAFFRRSVQSRYNETFKCTKGAEDCEISLITRKNCQFCRYQSCIAAGMRPSWILSDEERVRRFHGRAKVEPKLEPKREVPSPSPSPDTLVRSPGVSPQPSLDPYSALGEGDRARILSYGGLMLSSLGSGGFLEAGVVTELLQVSHHSTSLSGNTALQVSLLLEQRTLAALQRLPEFQALPATAQGPVVQHNLPLVHRFRQALCLACPTTNWGRLVEMFVGPHLLRSCKDDMPHDLSGKASPVRGMEYSDLLSSPSCRARPELEAAHLALVRELAASLDLEDEVQVILTALIIAFCPDFLDLGERGAVEQTQLRFVLLLQSHLASLDPSLGSARLARNLMVPAIARQINSLAPERLLL